MNKQNIIFTEKSKRKTFRDIEGESFGRLLVLGYAGIKGKKIKQSYWYVQCSCANQTIKTVSTRSLVNGNATSCGCYSKEVHSTHGMTGSSELSSFMCAKNRCLNPNDKEYHNYGARGIEFKLDSVMDIINDIGYKPEPKSQYSIERIDTNGHYEVGNLKWATMKEQQRNRRDNRYLNHNGKTKLLTDWSNEYGVSTGAICGRIKDGWCESCAITIPTHKKGQPTMSCPHQ